MVVDKTAVGNLVLAVAAENLYSVSWVHVGRGHRHRLSLEVLDLQDFLA